MTYTINVTSGLVWSGASSGTSGGTLVSWAGTAHATIDLIRPLPGQTVRIVLSAVTAADTSAAMRVLIQGIAYTITGPTTIQHPYDPRRALYLDTVNLARATLAVYVISPDTVPATASPWQVLALEAWLPIETDSLTWDESRWDTTSWDRPETAPGTLVWDEGIWDGAYWYDETLTYAWRSILDPVVKIDTYRGVSSTGPVLAAQTGTLTIEALDGLDPRALGITTGTPIRLYCWTNRHPIFTGWIDSTSTQALKTGGYTATLHAVDVVARAAAITRYGARPDGGGTETAFNRAKRLISSLPDVVFASNYGPQARLTAVCPTVWETSVAAHLDALVATIGGGWYATRDGRVMVYFDLPAPASTPVQISDQGSMTGTNLLYTQGAASWASTDCIREIVATNHAAAPDDAGEWRAADSIVTAVDGSVAAAWGGSSVKVDLIAADDAAAQAAAARLLTASSTAPGMRSATIHVADRARPYAIQHTLIQIAASRELLTWYTARQRDEARIVLCTSIAHSITPHQWDMTLGLTDRSTT